MVGATTRGLEQCPERRLDGREAKEHICGGNMTFRSAKVKLQGPYCQPGVEGALGVLFAFWGRRRHPAAAGRAADGGMTFYRV